MTGPLPDVEFLRTFRLVVEEGSFAAAGREARLTQPGVSYQIRRLEEQLGVPLFDRGGRGAVPTPAGRVLYEFVVDHLDRLSAVVASLAADGAEGADPFRVASVGGFGRYVLFPRLLAGRFRRVRFVLRYMTATRVYGEVEDGGFDLGFVYRPRTSPRLRLLPVYEEELVFIRSATGGAAGPDGVSLEACETMPFVTYEESDYVFGTWFDAIFDGQPGPLRTATHVERLEEAVDLVAAGRGASVVPADCVDRRGEAVAILRPGGRRCLNTVYAVHRAGGYVRPRAEELLATFDATGERASDRESGGRGDGDGS